MRPSVIAALLLFSGWASAQQMDSGSKKPPTELACPTPTNPTECDAEFPKKPKGCLNKCSKQTLYVRLKWLTDENSLDYPLMVEPGQNIVFGHNKKFTLSDFQWCGAKDQVPKTRPFPNVPSSVSSTVQDVGPADSGSCGCWRTMAVEDETTPKAKDPHIIIKGGKCVSTPELGSAP